ASSPITWSLRASSGLTPSWVRSVTARRSWTRVAQPAASTSSTSRWTPTRANLFLPSSPRSLHTCCGGAGGFFAFSALPRPVEREELFVFVRREVPRFRHDAAALLLQATLRHRDEGVGSALGEYPLHPVGGAVWCFAWVHSSHHPIPVPPHALHGSWWRSLLPVFRLTTVPQTLPLPPHTLHGLECRPPSLRRGLPE